MAEAKEVAAPKIDVAEGGKIAGYGETFDVNLISGTPSFTLPLPLAKARDVAPELALSYGGDKQNGPVGLGFSLAQPAISRLTDKGVPRYGEDDRFALSGAELTPKYDQVAGKWTKDERSEGGFRIIAYRPRIESVSSLIEWWIREDGTWSYWRVVDSENVETIYGRSESCRVHDPAAPARIYQWSIESRVDSKGNSIRFAYKREDGANLPDDGHPPTAQIYPSAILYGNYPDGGGAERFALEVRFDYGEYDLDSPALDPVRSWPARADPFSTYRPGFELRTWRLCRNIFTIHHFPDQPGVGDCLSDVFALGYDEAPAFSKLKSVCRIGHRKQKSGSYVTESMPPITFEFGEFDPGGGRLETLAVDGEPPIPGYPGRGAFQFVDLYGEGIAGVLYSDERFQAYWRGLSGGRYQPPAAPAQFPIERALEPRRRTLMDVRGDGHRDLVVQEQHRAGYYRNNNDGTWQPYVAFASHAPEAVSEAVEYADLDGSGRSGLMTAAGRARLRVYPSLGDAGFGPPALHLVEQGFPASVPQSEREIVAFAGIFGDGLQHRVRLTDGMIQVWPNLGHGRFAPPVALAGSPNFGDLLTTQRIFFADVTGSGYDDLVLAYPSHLAIYRNQSGNGFAEPLLVIIPPGIDDLDQINWADVTGDGRAEFVLSKAGPRIVHHYLSFAAERQPHLLAVIDNNFGAVTTLRYRSSTAYQLADRLAGRPWAANLSMVVQLVDEVVQSDSTTGWEATTRYQYSDGYYDPVEREFRGFGYVQSQNAQAYAPVAWHFPAATPAPAAAAAFAEVEPSEPCLTRQWNNNGAAELVEARSMPLPSLDGVPLTPADVLDPAIAAFGGPTLRQAYRALRDHEAARQVLGVAEDGTPNAIALTTSGQNYLVTLLQPVIDGFPGSFLVTQRQSRTAVQDGEAADIRVADQFNLAQDQFGNITRSASIAYPRPGASHPEQQNALLVTAKSSAFVNHPETAAEPFRHIGLLYEEISHEVNGLGWDGAPFEFEAVESKIGDALAPGAVIPFGRAFTPGALQSRPYKWTRDLYWNDARTEPLPLGEVAGPALLYHRLSASFSTELAARIWGARVDAAMLESTGGSGGGYVLADDYWWSADATRSYGDASTYFSVTATADPFGSVTRFTYDPYHFDIVSSTDALGQVVTVSIDYQALQPDRVVDVNGNTLQTVYGPLGNMVAFSRYGTYDGRAVGDRPLDDYAYAVPANRAEILADPDKFLQGAGSFYWEDYLALSEGEGAVNSVHVEANRAANPTDPAHQGPDSHGFTLVFVDGLARRICSQDKVEPEAVGRSGGEAWLTSGQVIYNKQGKEARRYNPYITAESGYVERPDAPYWTETYDAMGRSVRKDDPKGFYSKTQYGPWQRIVWDEDDTILSSTCYRDNIGNTQPDFADQRDALVKAAAFDGTPTSFLLDPLGRDAVREQVNVFAPPGQPVEHAMLRTASWLDIAGNIERQADPRFFAGGAPTLFNFVRVHDMAGRAVQIESTDRGKDAPGTARQLHDAAGNLLCRWDNEGTRVRHDYDVMRRPIGVYVTDNGPEYKAEDIVYGTDPAINSRDRVVLRRDEAQEAAYGGYDLLGNPLAETRRFPEDYAAPIDWADPAKVAMLPESWRLGAAFSRRGWPLAELNADGSVQSTAYYANGWRASVAIALSGAGPAPAIVRILYAASGTPTLTEYGNATTTGQSYDPDTLRLTGLVTTRNSGSASVQDEAYYYDPVGNVTRIVNRLDPGTPALSDYTYDAIYALRVAKGRQQAGAMPSDPGPARAPAGGGDPTVLVPYTETYAFDPAGNLTRIVHSADTGGGQGSWQRDFAVSPTSNHAVPKDMLSGGGTPDDYFDLNGNLTALPDLPALAFDYRNGIASATIVARTQGEGDIEYYSYDRSAERRRKVRTRVQSGGAVTQVEETLYIGNYIVTRTSNVEDGHATPLSRSTSLRVMAGTECVLIVNDDGFGAAALFRYQLASNLRSVTTELDAAGLLITYEEYFPYGGAAIAKGRTELELATKRYRYVGKERDGATGLYCIGLRYYVPGLARWLTPDPDGARDSLNLYAYVGGNPTTFVDPSGRARLTGNPATVALRQARMDADLNRAVDMVDEAIALLEPTVASRSNWLWSTLWRSGTIHQPDALVIEYFGIHGTSRTDANNLIELLDNFKQIRTYLTRPPVVSRLSWRYAKSFFVNTPQFNVIDEDGGNTIAYVQGASVNWPDWRILPPSVRSRPTGVLTVMPWFVNKMVNGLRRLTPSDGINLYDEAHFGDEDANTRASTIVHEASHLVLGTDDHAYGYQAKFRTLTSTEQLYNADSYGLFARSARQLQH